VGGRPGRPTLVLGGAAFLLVLAAGSAARLMLPRGPRSYAAMIAP
jgi:hypothetical protein